MATPLKVKGNAEGRSKTSEAEKTDDRVLGATGGGGDGACIKNHNGSSH